MRSYCGKKIMSVIMTMLIGVTASSFCAVDAEENEKSAVTCTQNKEVKASFLFKENTIVYGAGAVFLAISGVFYKYSDDFKTKEQLLEELPVLWERFYVKGFEMVKAGGICKFTRIREKARDAVFVALVSAFKKTDAAARTYSGIDADFYSILATAENLNFIRNLNISTVDREPGFKIFTKHWERSGRLYNWIKNADEGSIRNLVKVLKSI